MKRFLGIVSAVAVIIAGASGASASLVFTTDVTVSGTGLGAVNTLVTVHDPGGPGNQNGTESGCITAAGAFSPCEGTVEGGDNTAINQTFTLSDVLLAGQDAGDLAVVVNISETGQDVTVTLTDLYITLTDPTTLTSMTFSYDGPDKDLTQGSNEGTGLGNSGFVFTLDATQGDAAAAFCTNIDCIISGGVQFLNGSTNDGNDTIHIINVDHPSCEPDCGPPPPPNAVPAPASAVLLGAGLLAARLLRRGRRGV